MENIKRVIGAVMMIVGVVLPNFGIDATQIELAEIGSALSIIIGWFFVQQSKPIEKMGGKAQMLIIPLILAVGLAHMTVGCKSVERVIEKAESWVDQNPELFDRIQAGIDAATTLIAVNHPEYTEIIMALDDITDSIDEGTTQQTLNDELANQINKIIDKEFPNESEDVKKLLSNNLVKIIGLERTASGPPDKGYMTANYILRDLAQKIK